MSASQIPNLRTWRAKGAFLRRPPRDVEALKEKKSKDVIIRSTDNDAATSRLSAVDAGYLDDPFAKLLTTSSLQRRLPLMNRGTYVRTVGIDQIVDTFMTSQPGRKQIVSLGAGSDTRYFRLKQKSPKIDLIYHELDFKENTKIKIEQIRGDDFAKNMSDLCSIDINDYQIGDDTLVSSTYNIYPYDLRDLPTDIPGIKRDLPTLLISECCLIYLSPEEADNVLKYFVGMFSTIPLAIAIYEPIRPNDSFGRTMVRNLTSRGIHLQTLEKYAELGDQQSRLRTHDFEPRAEDIYFIWQNWIDAREKERVDGLEWMDEVEEFVLLANHYCIAWGWKGWTDDSKWRALPWNAKQ